MLDQSNQKQHKIQAAQELSFQTVSGLNKTFKMWKTIFSPEMFRKAVP